MEYELATRYLARIWLDLPPFRPTEEVFAKVRGLIKRPDFHSGMAQDVASGQRGALFTPSGLQIFFPGDSFDVSIVPSIEGDREVPLPRFADFVAQVAPYM